MQYVIKNGSKFVGYSGLVNEITRAWLWPTREEARLNKKAGETIYKVKVNAKQLSKVR